MERLGPYALSYWVPDEGREAVWEGLRDGTIDLFSSDHAPHLREEKEIGWEKMWSAHTGTPGIQYFYPLALDAVNKGQLTLDRVVELMAWAPAQKFGLAGKKGALTPGNDADFVIADMDASWTIRNEDVLSRCGWTCYDSRQLSAAIEATYVRSTPVFGDGKVIGAAGHGRLATRGP
ncbi:MAG: amidohydrolase family protein [Streptosporangiaceae bacterium]